MTGLVPVTVKPRFVGFDDIKQFRIAEGASLEEIALEAADILPPEFWTGHGVICVGGERVPAEMWRHVRPRVVEGREIAVTLNIVPAGNDPKTAGILTTLAGVAITTAGILLTPTFPVLGPLITNLGIGITLAGVGMLLAPVPSQPKEGAQRESLQAGVSENSAAPFEWLPRVLGRMVFSPPQLIRPYTVYSRRSIKVCGAVGLVGRHAVSAVRINGALADSMDNLDYETRTGLSTDTALTLGNQWVYEEGTQIQLSNFDLSTDSGSWDELFDQTTPENSYPQYQTFLTRTGDAPDKVVVRVLFPQGMVADTSDNVTLNIPLRISFRLRGSSTWIEAPEFHFYDDNKGNAEIRQNITFTWVTANSTLSSPNSNRVSYVAYYRSASGAPWQRTANVYFSNGASNYAYHVTRDDDGFTVYLNPATFPQTGHYEFRIKRGLGYRFGLYTASSYQYDGSTANLFDRTSSASPKTVQIEQHKFRGDAQIEAFQTWHNEYPLADALAGGVPLTLIAFEGRDMEINSVSALFESEVPIYSGGNWNTIAATRNPAAHYRHVLLDSLNSDPRDPAIVNSSILQDWYAHCTTQGYQCNAIVSANEPEVLGMIASSGWAGQRSHEQFDVILERDRSSFSITQNFTPLNSSNYIATKAFVDLPHGFNVEYADDADDNKLKTEIVYAPGIEVATATRFETIRMDGITVRAKVLDRTRNLLRTLYYRQVERRIDVGIEALVSRRGDLVGLSHDIVSNSVFFGVVVSVQTSGANVTGITLNARAMLSSATGPFSAILRYSNGVLVIKQIVQTSDTTKLTFSTPFTIPAGGVLAKGCLVSIGVRSQETARCIVSNIIYKDEFNATVALIDEAPEIYTGVFRARGEAHIVTTAAAVAFDAGGIIHAGDGTAPITVSALGGGAATGTVSGAGSATVTTTALAAGGATGVISGAGSAAVIAAASGAAASTAPSSVPIYKTVLVDTTNVAAGGNYTFSGVDFGVAHAKRIVILGVKYGSGGLINLPTVGGITGSEVFSTGNWSIIQAAVPTGTTGTIVFNVASGTIPFVAIGVWIAYPNSATAIDSVANQITSSTSPVVASDVSIVPGGFVIAFGGLDSALQTLTGTWSGSDAVVENFDQQVEATATIGGYSIATTQTSTTFDFSLGSTGTTSKRVIAASWGAS